MKKFLLVILAVAIFCFVSNLCSAQDEEDLDYSWGLVVRVFSSEIIVSEYDYDSDEEIDVVYKIDSDTELKNMESLEDLVEGDSVEIGYVVKGENKIIKTIRLEEPPEESFLEEEYRPQEEIEY